MGILIALANCRTDSSWFPNPIGLQKSQALMDFQRLACKQHLLDQVLHLLLEGRTEQCILLSKYKHTTKSSVLVPPQVFS